MTDYQHTHATTQPEQQKPVFVLGMIIVKELNGILVIENCARFLKRHPVLPPAFAAFLLRPIRNTKVS